MDFKSPEDFSSLFELLEYFTTEEVCLNYLTFQRWQGAITCPFCDHDRIYDLKGANKRFKCGACHKHFTAKAGTIFEDSKIPLRKWFAALYLILSHRKGVSSYQLARDLKLTQKTAWFLGHRIRNAIRQGSFDRPLDGIVEIDETFVGGKNKNRHWDKKAKNSQGGSDKTIVFGMLERDGIVRAFPVPTRKIQFTVPLIERNVEESAILMTDDFYPQIEGHEHHIVNHSLKQYAIGENSTNGIENFWGNFKRIFAVYHKVSHKHLRRYVDESVFRFNVRRQPDGFRVLNLLSELNGSSLKYKQLVYEQKEKDNGKPITKEGSKERRVAKADLWASRPQTTKY
jgi:transposase-like protein